MKRKCVVIFGVIIAILPTACSSGTSSEPTWATYSGEVNADSALMEDELKVDGGCVILIDDDGTKWLPVFPEDLVSDWNEGIVVSGDVIAPGDRVRLGGSEIDAFSDYTVPAECDSNQQQWLTGAIRLDS